MNRHLTQRVSLAVLASGVLLIAAAAAIGATRRSVTLNLHGGRTQKLAACHQTHRHPYHVYRVNTKVTMDGFVTPAPSQPDGAWRVKIKFKQCKGSRFVTVAEVHVPGRTRVVHGVKKGYFSYTRPLGVRGVFFARAYYYGYTPPLISADQDFEVTR